MRKINFILLSSVVLALAGCKSSNSVVESSAAPFLKIGQDYCIHYSNGLAATASDVRVLGVSGDFVRIGSIHPKTKSADHQKEFWVNERLISGISTGPCKIS